MVGVIIFTKTLKQGSFLDCTQFDSLVESGDLAEALMSDRARRAAVKARNASSIQNQGSGGEWGRDKDGPNTAKRRKGRLQIEDEEDSSDGRGLKPEAILAMKQVGEATNM